MSPIDGLDAPAKREIPQEEAPLTALEKLGLKGVMQCEWGALHFSG